MNKEQPETVPEEYIPGPAKMIPPFITGIAMTVVGDTALYYKLFALALLCYVIVAISIVWIIRAEMRKERAEYHMWRRVSKALNEVDGFKDRLDKVETGLSLKAGRPARSNIRPGSRPSAKYEAMKREKLYDDWSENS